MSSSLALSVWSALQAGCLAGVHSRGAQGHVQETDLNHSVA